MSLSIVILAAGQGTRMRSDLPKVLQPLAGRPLLAHVLECADELDAASTVVVYGHGAEQLRAAFAHREDLSWVLQAEQLGTGHALARAMPQIPDSHVVLVLYGDVPLIRPQILETLVSAAEKRSLGLLTVVLDDPTGYGRIVRDASGKIARIVEEKDATADERGIREVNTGLIACPATALREWLDDLSNDNAQGESYLSDVAALAVRDGVEVHAVSAPDATEVLGVNDKRELATVEAAYRRGQADRLLARGVTLADPARLDVRGPLACGRDVFIDVNAVFEGEVELGDRVRIGPNACISNSVIGDDTEVHACCVIDGARVGRGCQIGPFARIRPETQLDDTAKVGNFVEVKKSRIGAGSKVNHLTYIGDTTIGREANIGAGTITCNYDGAAKHRTVIGDGAFIGSGTQLIAPVTIGAEAYIGSGSVITKDAPPGKLSLARARQVTVPGWEPPRKGKKG